MSTQITDQQLIDQVKRLLALPGVELLFDAQYDDGEPDIAEGLTRGGTKFVSVTSPQAETFTMYLSNPGGLSPEDEHDLSYVNACLWDETFPRLFDAVREAEQLFGDACCTEVRALQRYRVYFAVQRKLQDCVMDLLGREFDDDEKEADLAIATLQLARGLLAIIPPYQSNGEPMQEIDVDTAYMFRGRTVERLQDAVHNWDLKVATMQAEEEV